MKKERIPGTPSYENDLKRARIGFFSYRSPRQIANDLELDEEEIWRWIRREKWPEERERLSKEVVKEAFDRAAYNVAQDIITPSYSLIRNSIAYQIAKCQQTNTWLTFKQMNDLTQIISQFTKLLKLEMGQPTEIVQNYAPLSLEEIRQAIVEDQFVDIIPLKIPMEKKNVSQ